MPSRPVDILGGTGFFAAALLIAGAASRLRVGTALDPGPGFYPLVLAIALGAVSLGLVVAGIRHRTDPSPASPAPPAGRHRTRLLLSVVGLLAYPALLNYLGFPLATFLFVSFALRLVERAGWPRVMFTAVAISVLCYLVFVRLLAMPFPRGVFG